MTEVGETATGADAARERISQPAGRDPDLTPFCTRWEDKGRGGILSAEMGTALNPFREFAVHQDVRQSV